MSLPILTHHPKPTNDDLVRFFHRTELQWSRQLAEEEETLDVGTALFNPSLAVKIVVAIITVVALVFFIRAYWRSGKL